MAQKENLYPIGSLVRIIRGRYSGKEGVIDGYIKQGTYGHYVYDISIGMGDGFRTQEELSKIAEGRHYSREIVIRTGRAEYDIELIRYPNVHSHLTAEEKKMLTEKQEEVARTKTRRIIF